MLFRDPPAALFVPLGPAYRAAALEVRWNAERGPVKAECVAEKEMRKLLAALPNGERRPARGDGPSSMFFYFQPAAVSSCGMPANVYRLLASQSSSLAQTLLARVSKASSLL